MASTFIAIADPVHELLRKVTRRTLLCPHPSGDGIPVFQYRFRPGELPEDYYGLAAFHSLAGLPAARAMEGRWRVNPADKARLPQQVNYFDAVRLDRRCCRDLRRKLRVHGPGMVAADLLCYGVGVLRARNDDPGEPVHRHLWSQYGRLSSQHEKNFARIRTLHWSSCCLLAEAQKESYDSTNVIFGDALGEVQQLWDRRADTFFLDLVAQSLGRLRSHGQTAAYVQPPLNLELAMQFHVRAQARWKTPPPSGRSLLRRIDYLLEHTVLDDTVKTEYLSQPQVPPPGNAHDQDWDSDRSGYDGWLPGSEALPG